MVHVRCEPDAVPRPDRVRGGLLSARPLSRSPAVQATRERRLIRRGPPAAQSGGRSREGFIKRPLGEAFGNPGDLGEQVGPAARELAQRGYRGGLLVRGELTPLRVMLRLAVELGDENPVGLRASVDYAFECRTGPDPAVHSLGGYSLAARIASASAS